MGSGFACRSCAGHPYRVQSQNGYLRAVGKLRREARRIGGIGALLEGPDRRPKVMRRATYGRTTRRQLRATDRVGAELARQTECSMKHVTAPLARRR